MSDSLEEFSSNFDLDASSALNSPSLIFLCGGKINGPSKADSSLRALFYNQLKIKYSDLLGRVLLAEDANKWSKIDGQYRNLLDLESDLAWLSAVILLFVESPGSIAELGAFSQTEVLRDKLVAILEHSYQEKESFIRDGPVALLLHHDKKSVFFLPWFTLPNGSGKRVLDKDQAQDTVEHILRWLSKNMKGLSKEEKFRKTDIGHRLLLIADFISLGTIVRRKEIVSFLRGLELDIPIKRLTQFLFLLEKLNIIDRTQYGNGNSTYFLARSASDAYIHYAFKTTSKPADRLRIKSDLMKVLPKDVNRQKALNLYWKTRGK
jgi:hypothetical protein